MTRVLTLLFAGLVSLGSSSAFAASYQQIDGTIVDPIQNEAGGDHPYSGINLEPAAHLGNANLFGASLSSADLSGSVIFSANLSNANLDFADLSGAIAIGIDLSSASLSHAVLGGASMSGADLTSANLSDASASHAILEAADLSSADIANANLSSGDLVGAIMQDSDLSGADLSGVRFHQSDLSNADLRGATLANAIGLGTSFGSAIYDLSTDFTNAWSDGSNIGDSGAVLFDPVAAGWTFVPEPSSALLLGIGLSALAVRREQR